MGQGVREQHVKQMIVRTLCNREGDLLTYADDLTKIRTHLFKKLRRKEYPQPTSAENATWECPLDRAVLQAQILQTLTLTDSFKEKVVAVIAIIDKQLALANWWKGYHAQAFIKTCQTGWL